MKVIVALAFAGWLLLLALVIVLSSLAASAAPLPLSFTDAVVDIRSLGGQQVIVAGTGRMDGDDLLLYRDRASLGTFIFIQIDDLPREQRKIIFDRCSQLCDVLVEGEVGEDENGSKGILATIVKVK